MSYRWLRSGSPRPAGPRCDIGAFEECVDDPAPDQGNVIRAVKRDDDVELHYEGAAASSWRIYRDSSKTSIGTSALPPDTGFTVFTDSGAVPPGAGGRFFYYLRGLSPCTLTPGP